MDNNKFKDRKNRPAPREEDDSGLIIGRNPVTEALKAGLPIDTVYIDPAAGGSAGHIRALAKERGIVVKDADDRKLSKMCRGASHQGVAAVGACAEYAEIDDIFRAAEEKGEEPFIIICDEIEDPHNLGAIIRTANLAGAHGVIIPKNRAVGLTPTVVRTSAGALAFTPVARVTNLTQTMEELKKKGLWFVCADMQGEVMYKQNLTGPIGVVIGNEGEGVSRLVKENCDFTASIPMKGDIDSLNASVAAGVLAFEVVRQRMEKGGMSAL